MYPHTHRSPRQRVRILMLVLCALVSVHGMQLTAWILTRDDRAHVIDAVAMAASRRTERLLRRLAARPTEEEALHAAAPVPQDDPSVRIFPSFGTAVFPVSVVPDWGSMAQPTEWNRTFAEMPASAFVPLPVYDRAVLTRPMTELLEHRAAHAAIITAKLTYSTRYFGAYDLDADECTGNHPGIDIKLAEGTPVGAAAGGRVWSVQSYSGLGHTVIVEHRHPREGTLFSIYGHLGEVSVRSGEDVSPGTMIGRVGMTGRTTAPHLHWQIDRAQPDGGHILYVPQTIPPACPDDRFSVHPVTFVLHADAHMRATDEDMVSHR